MAKELAATALSDARRAAVGCANSAGGDELRILREIESAVRVFFVRGTGCLLGFAHIGIGGTAWCGSSWYVGPGGDEVIHGFTRAREYQRSARTQVRLSLRAERWCCACG